MTPSAACTTAMPYEVQERGRIIVSALKSTGSFRRGLVAPLETPQRAVPRARWVWLPSPGRVALQRSCALQLLQFVDSTIELAMLPRRFDCSNGSHSRRTRAR